MIWVRDEEVRGQPARQNSTSKGVQRPSMAGGRNAEESVSPNTHNRGTKLGTDERLA